MLLTLNATSLARRLHAKKRADQLDVADLPQFTLEQLALRGLVIDTSLLRGWSMDDLDRFHNRADQAGCPCLILRESTPVPAGTIQDSAIGQVLERTELVARAAHRLGCSSIAITPQGISDETSFTRGAAFLRQAMERIDRLELNLLIEPGEQMMADPESLIALIKKVGGFRVGTMPNFQHASDSKDAESTLRQTAPYAGAVLATCGASPSGAATTKKKKTKTKKKTSSSGSSVSKDELNYIQNAVRAIRNVGYGQILAIDYVGDDDGIEVIEATRQAIEEVLAEEE